MANAPTIGLSFGNAAAAASPNLPATTTTTSPGVAGKIVSFGSAATATAPTGTGSAGKIVQFGANGPVLGASTPAPAKSSGGGGVLGFLGRALSSTASDIEGTVGGIADLGGDLSTAIFGGGGKNYIGKALGGQLNTPSTRAQGLGAFANFFVAPAEAVGNYGRTALGEKPVSVTPGSSAAPANAGLSYALNNNPLGAIMNLASVAAPAGELLSKAGGAVAGAGADAADAGAASADATTNATAPVANVSEAPQPVAPALLSPDEAASDSEALGEAPTAPVAPSASPLGDTAPPETPDALGSIPPPEAPVAPVAPTAPLLNMAHIPSPLETIGRGMEHVGNVVKGAPMAPLRALSNGPRIIGNFAQGAVDRAAGLEPREDATLATRMGARLPNRVSMVDSLGKPSALGKAAQAASELSDVSRNRIGGAIRHGQAVASSARGLGTESVSNVARALRDENEQAQGTTGEAMYHAAENTADIWHKIHGVLADDPEEWGHFLKESGAEKSVTPEGIEYARQAMHGEDAAKAEHLTQAMGHWLRGTGAEGHMGAGERTAAYEERAPWQAGKSPNPIAMSKAMRLPDSFVRQAETIAHTRRAIADTEARHLSDLQDEADRQLSGPKGAQNNRLTQIKNAGVEAVSARMRAASQFDKGAAGTLRGREIADERNENFEAKVNRAIAKGGKVGAQAQKALEADRLATKLEKRAERLRGRREVIRSIHENKLENMPARFRPMIAVVRAAEHHADLLDAEGKPGLAQDLRASVADEPHTLADIRSQNKEARYLPHFAPDTLSRDATRFRRPLINKTTAEKVRSGSLNVERSPKSLLKAQDEEARFRGQTAMVGKLMQREGVHRGEGDLKGVTTAAEAAERGYKPIIPEHFMMTGKVADLKGDETLPDDTYFVKVPVFNRIQEILNQAAPGKLNDAMEAANSLYYQSRLALSPSLPVGRIGHVGLQLIGGHDPLTVFNTLRDVIKQYNAQGDETGAGKNFSFLPPEVTKEGQLSPESLKGIHGVAKDRGKVVEGAKSLLKPLKYVGEKNMALAHFVDNSSRGAYYLAELAKEAKKGVPSDAAIENAIQTTRQALGSFDDMTPTEQRFIRPLVPFYAWHKAIARIVLRLPADHPLSAYFLAQLGIQGNEAESPQQQGLGSYYNGDIPIGNSLVDPAFLFPWTETGSSFSGGLLGLSKDMNPLAKIGLGSLVGANPNTLKQWYMPPGTPENSFGRPEGPSVLQQLANLIPQASILGLDTNSEPYTAYANGQPVIKAGTTAPSSSGTSFLDNLISQFGITATNKNVAYNQEPAGTALKTTAAQTSLTSAANYAKRVAAWEAAGSPLSSTPSA